MAANKRKILEAARKYAQKGAKDRALKEYEQLLRLDPKDAKLRLEIGDAYRRWGQVDEAIAAYTKVADQYTKEGFDARAVAVFKQIQNLAPDRFDSYEPLAELYQRMGLTAEAISALQTAADGFHRQSKKREALGLLRKMATLDPTNTSSRLKVADLLRQEKLFSEAIDEYEEVAAELQRQGVTEAVGSVLERILELEPDRLPTVKLLAQNLLARGLGERAEPYAKRLLDGNPAETEYYDLLADVYRSQQREDALKDVYRRLADLYRRRGDEENARQIMQRFAPPDALSVSAGTMTGGEVLLDREATLDDENSLIDDEFLDDGLGEDLLEEPQGAASANATPRRSTAEETVLQPQAGAARGARSSPEGDPEQLFAEASVYLRYGKRAQAIENLHAILVQNPRHRAALEKLGDAHADAREPQEAVEAWLSAAELAREESDLAALEVLRDRIAALDESAAAQVSEWLPERAEAPASEGDLDTDVSDLIDVELPETDATQERAEREFELGDIEIDVDTDELDEEDPAAESRHSAPPVTSVAAPPAGASASASASQQISEDLEEADFYFQQGLHSEAEAIYQRVVAQAPNHPLALVRLGEIAAARGADPGATGSGFAETASEADAPETAVDPDIGSDLADWDADASGAAPTFMANALASDGDLEIEVEDEPLSEQPELLAGAAAETPTEDEIAPLASPELEPIAAEETPVEDSEPEESLDPDGDTSSDSSASAPTFLAPDAGEAGFDLAAELSDAFDDDRSGASTSGASAGDDGFASVFGEFKKGVSRMLSEGDHEAHYDLGIAYREMGLLADAASEFQAAMGKASRRIDCLHMLGLCTLEQGSAAAAVTHFEAALASAESTPEQQLAVRFELGRAFAALGDRVRARGAFEAVAAIDPSFCDVEEHLERVDDENKPEAQDAAGDFESFGDLIGESAEPVEVAPAGQENFDDVIAEANEVEAEPELLNEAIDDAPETPEPAPRVSKTSRGPAAKPARKKRISFVRGVAVEHLQHFGLAEDPFRNEPRLDTFFETHANRDALRRLERGLRQAKGLHVLVGDVGAGKTMVVRRLLESLEEEVFDASMLVVLHGAADASWMLGRFAAQLGIEEPAPEREGLLAQIYDKLAIIREDGRHAVLIIDDAQALAGNSALAEVCGLLKLEYEERRLLSLVLAGAPSLELAIANDPGLAHRVDVKVRLDALDPTGAAAYLTHRIDVAGGNSAILEPGAVAALHSLGGGLPGRMNTLADNALFEAFLCGRSKMTRTDVERAQRDLSVAEAPATNPAAAPEARKAPTQAPTPGPERRIRQLQFPAGASAEETFDFGIARPSESRSRRPALEIIDPIEDSLGDLDSELEAVFETSDPVLPPSYAAPPRPHAPRQAPPKRHSEESGDDLLIELLED